MMRKYLGDRDLIPAGRLREVCFDDLESRQLEAMERVYRDLDLDGIEDAEPAMSAVIAGASDYRKNRAGSMRTRCAGSRSTGALASMP